MGGLYIVEKRGDKRKSLIIMAGIWVRYLTDANFYPNRVRDR